MPADLDTLFAAARADADALPLAGPDELRRAGDRRGRVARGAAVAGVAGAALAVALVTGAFFAGGSPATAPALAGEPSGTPWSVAPSPTAPGSTVPAELCRASQLRADARTAAGESGGQQTGITFANRSGELCLLRGFPNLTSSSGQVPVERGESQPMLRVMPGNAVTFLVVTAGPSACGDAKAYRDIAATFDDGTLPIPGLAFEPHCGPIKITWTST
jgi:hypothetical protein